MCCRLSAARNLPLFAVDTWQWKPGWLPASYAEIKQQQDAALAQQGWIIDGWGPDELMRERFAVADTIILVDHPLYVHYWWAIKRQLACVVAERPDGPPGCPMLPMTWPLLKMIWRIHWQARPQLLDLVNKYRTEKRVTHIRSPRALRQFVAHAC
jgi:adenylate kinase family enzyme